MFLTIKVYSWLTELFEIVLIIGIKIDLALNNIQKMIYYKTQPTNWATHIVWTQGSVWNVLGVGETL